MTDRSSDRTDGADSGYDAGTPEFGDAESGGLAAEPGNASDAGGRDESAEAEREDRGFGDLAGTPTGDLGGGSSDDVAQDRDIDRDLGDDAASDRPT